MRSSLMLYLAFLLLSSTALAGPRDFVILQPGAPATEEEARPYVRLLLDYLDSKVGDGAFSGSFFGELEPGLAHINKTRPAYGFVSVGIYLKHGKGMRMTPLAQLVADGKREGPYFVMVREGRYSSLAELKGKQLAGSILFEPELFFGLGLGGKFKASDFELIPTTRTLRYLRKVAQDQLDAIVIDQRARQSLAKLKLKAELVPVQETAGMPHPLFVVFEGVAPEAERAKVQAAFVGLCHDATGKKVCENFDFDDFAEVTAKDLPPIP